MKTRTGSTKLSAESVSQQAEVDLARRQSLKLIAGAFGSLLLPSVSRAQEEEAPQLGGVPLTPFSDPLPLPPILHPKSQVEGKPYYRIELSEFQQSLHRELPRTTVWGFERTTPGPTIIARRDRGIIVDWVNRLPGKHRLAVDHNLSGAGKNLPETRAVVHLHGGHVAPESDGYPEDWKVPGQTQRVSYPNAQRAATLWYHDHAMGIARLNTMMGLAGFYILQDDEELGLDLPKGKYDVPLMLQDRLLDPFGRICYPVSGNTDSPWVPEFFGSHVLVNGKVWPFYEVEPRPYRFRILNASNARVYRLFLSPAQTFVQIGSDGGLLDRPAQVSSILLAPSERADVIIDFSGREGRRIVLSNDAPAPFPSGGKLIPHLIMQFRVNPFPSDKARDYSVPETLGNINRVDESGSIKTRRLSLDEIMGAEGIQHKMLLNGKAFMDPITEDPEVGTTEIWEFVNATIDAHPIHLHAVHFQLLDRRAFDTRKYKADGEIVYANRVLPPLPAESGWKDTILCPPGEVTRIIAHFDGVPGKYVWHCHTLEHEDNEMMRPLLLRNTTKQR